MRSRFPIFFLFGSVFFTSCLYSQSNYFGLSLFKLGSSSVTINKHLEPKFYSGIQYERYFSSFGLNADFEYGVNTIFDNCPNCVDQYNGRGHLNELNFFVGLAYRPFNKKSWPLQPFIEADFYLGRLTYSGFFTGGWSGGIYQPYHLYFALGGMAQLGINYQIGSRFRLSISSAARLGTAWKSSNYLFLINPTFVKTSEGTFSPIQLGFGVVF